MTLLVWSVLIFRSTHGVELPVASSVDGTIHRGVDGQIIPTIAPGQPSVLKTSDKNEPDAGAFRHNGARAMKKIQGAVTEVEIENTGTMTQTYVPITFGQIFAKGDLSAKDTVVGKSIAGDVIPLQMDVKATYPDGSIRHAVISAILPVLPAKDSVVIGICKFNPQSNSIEKNSAADLVRAKGVPASGLPASPDVLLSTGFDASVRIVIDGQTYTASVAPLLKNGSYSTWLSGGIANEWLVSAPLISAKGQAHPQLSARFAIRNYTGINAARVDVIVENDWAYFPEPKNLTYDVNVKVGKIDVFTMPALTHYSYARWRKTFWWGDAPQINIKENSAYLIASKAVPNFDQSFSISGRTLNELGATWNGRKTEIMGNGIASPYMPMTGGRGDIGLLPSWTAIYLLSMDKRARDVTLGTGDLAGSWSVHYRDKKTDRPVSLLQFPYMTILGRKEDTLNPATKKYEAFPTCRDCQNPNVADTAHEPAFNYLPYLLTGDYYQLEELQFWAMWNAFTDNPGYRGNELGLMKPGQVRAQAWGLRTIAQAAFITPDNDPLKNVFQKIVANNINWYNANYTNRSGANSLGVLVDGYAFSYENETGIAPWQDDFFTSVIGHLAELGFAGAQSLLEYKAKFAVSRMGETDFCWVLASSYKIIARPTSKSDPFSSIAQTYRPSLIANFGAQSAENISKLTCNSGAMAQALKTKVNEMVGNSDSVVGFPSNLQPALAYAVDAKIKGANDAWKIFISRSVKPDYSQSPQFAIVPRNVNF